MDLENSTNLFDIKKKRLPNYLLLLFSRNYFFYQFVNNFFSLLLWKIFLSVHVLNFSLEMYVPYSLNLSRAN